MIQRFCIAVVPCDEHRNAYRWVILELDGTRVERSAYAFSTPSGARIAGAVRLRDARLAP